MKGVYHLKKKKSVLLIVGIVVVVLLILLSWVNFFTDWIWFDEMGYTSVFWKEILTKLTYGVPIFLILTIGCYFYLQAMKKGYYKKIGGYESLEPEKKVNRAALILSAIFGLIEQLIPRPANLLYGLVKTKCFTEPVLNAPHGTPMMKRVIQHQGSPFITISTALSSGIFTTSRNSSSSRFCFPPSSPVARYICVIS